VVVVVVAPPNTRQFRNSAFVYWQSKHNQSFSETMPAQLMCANLIQLSPWQPTSFPLPVPHIIQTYKITNKRCSTNNKLILPSFLLGNPRSTTVRAALHPIPYRSNETTWTQPWGQRDPIDSTGTNLLQE
jgi:hypothetical protein